MERELCQEAAELKVSIGMGTRGRGNQHCLGTWSSTQGAIALFTAEAELFALVNGVFRMKVDTARVGLGGQ